MTARLIASLVSFAFLMALSASGGALVASWRAGLKCEQALNVLDQEIAKLKEEKAALQLAIEQQNSSIQAAAARTEAAEKARTAAEQYAAQLAAFSRSRMDKLQRTFEAATSCDEVLSKYWELRQ